MIVGMFKEEANNFTNGNSSSSFDHYSKTIKQVVIIYTHGYGNLIARLKFTKFETRIAWNHASACEIPQINHGTVSNNETSAQININLIGV